MTVWAYQHSARAIKRQPEECQAIGLGCGGWWSTKIHSTVDALLPGTAGETVIADKAWCAGRRLVSPQAVCWLPRP